ncbi:MAG: winged helix-turn-helix transcriptional regulator [Anaerolineales bacterium]|nr:winged helix-turn-helix transcriptional regulator [Anaerolineales bacterium]
MTDEFEAKNTRERVLHTLLSRERCTINELAEAVAINPISVRHHINRLEAEGLVASEEARHGVGRPWRLYFLTEKGREQFPTRYVQLTMRLLEQLKETMPQPMVAKLFSQMARDLASEYRAEVEGLSLEERLKLIQNLLTSEGFTVEWERHGDSYHIHEINCPYYRVGQDHPEVCSLDQTLISTLLGAPVQKTQCILRGDAHCTYVISNGSAGKQQQTRTLEENNEQR